MTNEKLSPSTVKVGDVLTGGREVESIKDDHFFYYYKDDKYGGMSFREANDFGFKVEKREEDNYEEVALKRRMFDIHGATEIDKLYDDIRAQERAEIIRKAEELKDLNMDDTNRQWENGYESALDDLIKSIA